MAMALAVALALAGNSIISQNKAPVTITLPLPKPGNIKHLCSKLNFHSKRPPHFLFLSNGGNPALSSVSKTTVSDVELQTSNPTFNTTSWPEFAKNVSGEWDGFGADFTVEGTPIELPQSVVPEAYREWEVKVFDWQTQCPTLAQAQELVMAYRTIKLLPTVGCEADAATQYSIDKRSVGGTNNKVAAFAYQSNGCYVAVWPATDNGTHKQLELEHCLVHPQDRESRVRIIQVIRVTDTKMALQNIRVFCEQWYGPFRNGDQLGGCAIRDSAFASTAALKASEVVGVWQGHNAIANFNISQTDLLQELLDKSVQKTERDEHDLIMLPKQLWCSVNESTDGETYCEVGWLFAHGRAVTSKCIFSSNVKLKEVSIAQETATLEGA